MRLYVVYSINTSKDTRGRCRCIMAAALLAIHVSLWAWLLSLWNPKHPRTKFQIIDSFSLADFACWKKGDLCDRINTHVYLCVEASCQRAYLDAHPDLMLCHLAEQMFEQTTNVGRAISFFELDAWDIRLQGSEPLCPLLSTNKDPKGSCRCIMAAALWAPHVSLWACLLSARNVNYPKTKLQIIYGCSILGSLLFFLLWACISYLPCFGKVMPNLHDKSYSGSALVHWQSADKGGRPVHSSSWHTHDMGKFRSGLV